MKRQTNAYLKGNLDSFIKNDRKAGNIEFIPLD